MLYCFPVALPVFVKEATKRNSAGIPLHHNHRDSPVSSGGMSSTTLWAFLSQLREPFMITLALSLLARIHNVLKDDSKFDIHVDYVNMWPSSISGLVFLNLVLHLLSLDMFSIILSFSFSFQN